MISPEDASDSSGSGSRPGSDIDTAAPPVHRDAPQARDGGHATAPAAHRATSYAQSAHHSAQSFAIEDSRWTRSAQLTDWAKLALAMAVYLGWTMVVYVFEPGLR